MNPIPRLHPSFRYLNATQFLGAMNDNIFKLLVTFFAIHHLGEGRSGLLTMIGGVLFALPFILFLPASGVLADRFSKRDVIVWSKVLEVVAMSAGVLVFWSEQPWLSFLVLFLMSAQSALFGPAKYGIIPELATKDQLSKANGLIVGCTYLAVILGTAGGAWLREATGDHFAIAGLVCVAISVFGTLAAIPMVRVPAANVNRRSSFRFYEDAWKTLKGIRGDRFLVLAILASAYFSLIGAFLQLNVIPYGIQSLGLTDAESGKMFLYCAFGMGFGSFVAGKLSGRNIEFGVLPIAAAGLGLSSALIAMGDASVRGTQILLAVAGLSAGLFIVPIDAFVQWRAPKDRVGEVIATMNWLGWIGILLASVLGVVMYGVLKLQPAHGFAVVGVLTLVLTVATVKTIPDFLVRFVVLVLTRIIYRIRAIGTENLPVEGGALLVSNHVSFMDALQILACQQRRIRFMMHRSIYENNPLRPLFRLMGVIPIAMEDPPKKIVESLQLARKAMDEGFMVCIFAEGALTRNGLMRGFKPGLERIVRNSSHPIIPVYIGGAWGSIFSHYYGKQHARMPTQLPYPVSVMFGKPLPPTAKAWEVRQAVQELSCDYFFDRKDESPSLGVAFALAARRNGSRPAMADTAGRRLTYGQALVGARVLAQRLHRHVGDQSHVGILLPPSVPGALTNIALAFLGKTTVNLNFTVSDEAFQSAIRQAGLKVIVTARAFLEKFPQYASLPGLVHVEDLLAGIGAGEKLRAKLVTSLPLSWWIARSRPDDIATIVFSSGTTGEPKGVMLSNFNLASNVESLSMVFRPRREDRLCAALPLFHSFGYTAGIWFPLLSGMSVTYHNSPLDGGKIAEVVRTDRCTALFATPTFLLAYLRKATKEDFASLRYVIVGAEKLKPRVADAFAERFGIRPLEGYGATELAPVGALSLPDVEITGIYQVGTKEGSVGQPVPGEAVRITDPETHQILPPGHAGLMWFRGPNVMAGYLGKPEKTAEAIRDGWYCTGDIAQLDDDGFITITDRLSRFSKIAGEMVPHMAIEDEYLRGLGRAEPVLAVTSIPDEKRGERLIVICTSAAGDVAALQQIIEKSAVPNLWKPDRNAYVQIDALPITGTGKLDVRGLRQLALAKFPAATEARG